MTTTKAQPAAVLRTGAQRPNAQGRTARNDGLSDLQRQADTSPTVARLTGLTGAMQRLAVVQREGEDDHEMPDEDLKLMASVKDGKIGSVYIGEGRIRMTHGTGPKETDHGTDVVRRFHIHKPKLAVAYKAAGGKAGTGMTMRSWAAEQIRDKSMDSVPGWVEAEITGPDDALEPGTKVPETMQMLEVFIKETGPAKGHISRGVAEKFSADQETIDGLRKALELANTKKTMQEKNQAFYDYVQEHVPKLKDKIRHPDEV